MADNILFSQFNFLTLNSLSCGCVVWLFVILVKESHILGISMEFPRLIQFLDHNDLTNAWKNFTYVQEMLARFWYQYIKTIETSSLFVLCPSPPLLW